MTTAYFPSQEAAASRSRNFSAWLKRFAVITKRPTRREEAIAAYLERHQHDLSPALWIELERRRLIP
jgi:hypothetical protein